MTAAPLPRRRGPHARLRRPHRRSTGLDLAVPRRADHRDRRAPTPAASRRCCGRCRGCSRRAPARCCSTARAVHRMPAKELARTLGLLPQSPIAPGGHHRRRPRRPRPPPAPAAVPRWSREDDAAVAAALRGHRHRRRWPTAPWTSCPAASASGSGSRWRWPSRPTCCCSTSRRRSSTSATRSRCSTCSPTSTATRGTTIVMVLHDLNLAARYADHLVAMATAASCAQGAPCDGAHGGDRRAVFGLDSVVIEDPVSGKPLVLPRGATTITDHRVGTQPAAASIERLSGQTGRPRRRVGERWTSSDMP